MAKYHRLGFTLLELLVAIAVFAVLAVTAYSGLSTVLVAKTESERMAAGLDRLQHAVFILSQDVEQMMPRSVRDEFGTTQPALQVMHGEALLALTRGGWPNPASRARSYMQRVAYMLEDDKLYRVQSLNLDRVPGEPVVRRLLLEGVEGMTLRFLNTAGQWQDDWPGQAQLDNVSVLPRAIEVTLTVNVWGEIRRVFVLTG